jgi:hypothetical protein
MAPILDIPKKDYERASQILKIAGIEYSIPKATDKFSESNKPDFIYVPSIELWVAKKRTFLGENWLEVHKKLQKSGERMLTIPEFVEVLKYTKENHKDIYNEITELRSHWRAEWLDADFKTKGNNLYINYNHRIDKNKSLVPQNSEVLEKSTLMNDKILGISLENWLENPTKQGLPSKKVKSGNLYYWRPGRDNNSVARFDAYSGGVCLGCYWDPSNGDSDLGVRAVRHE